ncbi:MAG TPA: hypothetical protein VHE12_00495 [bacterium]|nr:hypothetical protein [bacterium]
MRPLLAALFFLGPFIPQVWGRVPALPGDQPIESRMGLGLFGVLGGKMEYTLQGRSLRDMEDFKSVIYPLGDAEASRLIREAGQCQVVGETVFAAGLLTGCDIALFFRPTPLLNVDWADRVFTGFTVAQLVWGLGSLFDTNSEARKFNAVQRYNQVLRSRKGEAWEWTPLQLAWGPAESRFSVGVRF